MLLYQIFLLNFYSMLRSLFRNFDLFVAIYLTMKISLYVELFWTAQKETMLVFLEYSIIQWAARFDMTNVVSAPPIGFLVTDPSNNAEYSHFIGSRPEISAQVADNVLLKLNETNKMLHSPNLQLLGLSL